MAALLSAGAVLLGGVLLYYGASFLVGGASRLARMLGVPAVLVGLTVVSYGTSLPEFAVTTTSALKGVADLALGNVMGSNIANVGFILGVTALVSPVRIIPSLLKREIPLLLGVSVAMGLMSLDGTIGHLDGALLALTGLGYTLYCIHSVRRGAADIARQAAAEVPPVGGDEEAEEAAGPTLPSKLRNVGLILLGAVFLGGGAHSFVTGAVDIAETLGVSPRVIGLSLVALGTSLPELAASLMAAVKGEDDISVGNVVGSNFFNIVFVLGVAATVHPISSSLSDAAGITDFAVMLAFSAVLVPVAAFLGRVGRVVGSVLLAGYLAYVILLFFR